MSPMIIRDYTEEENNLYFNIGQSIGAGVTAGSYLVAMVAILDQTTKAQIRKENATTAYEKKNEDRNIYFIKNLFLSLTSTMISLFKYYYGNPFTHKPAAIIAGIPIGSAQELSHAVSNQLMKYRSDGGVFLAHQPGGYQTLRITLKAFGSNRYVLLSMIELLFMYGSETIVDVFKEITQANIASAPNLTPEIDPWEEFNKYALDQGLEERHLTFPVITRNKIYFNMYIETYGVREYVDLGLNMLEITLFLRKYNFPNRKKFARVVGEDEDYYYFTDDGEDKAIINMRNIEMGLESSLSGALLIYRMLMIMSGNSPERNIATTTALDLNKSNIQETSYDKTMIEMFNDLTTEDSLLGLSTKNKEELMQID